MLSEGSPDQGVESFVELLLLQPSQGGTSWNIYIKFNKLMNYLDPAAIQSFLVNPCNVC